MGVRILQCKYGPMSIYYLYAIKAEYQNMYGNEIGSNMFYEHFKPGRPYFFIPKDNDYYYALPAYSGEHSNYIINKKDDRNFRKMFFYLDKNGDNNPYVSLRSPVIVRKNHISEIKKAYFSELVSIVGHTHELDKTEHCYNSTMNKQEMIVSKFKQYIKDKDKIAEQVSSIPFLTRHKPLSELTLDDNMEYFKQLSDRADDIKTDIILPYDEHSTIFENEYHDAAKKNIIDGKGKVDTEFVKDRYKRPAMYKKFNQYLNKIYGHDEQKILLSSYVNKLHINENIYDTVHINNISGFLKRTVKYIPSFQGRDNRNTIYRFIPAVKTEADIKTINDLNKLDSIHTSKKNLLNTLIKNDSNIHLTSKGTSYIKCTNLNRKDCKNQVDVFIRKGENVDHALDLVISSYVFNHVNEPEKNNKFRYKFSSLFMFNHESAEIQMLIVDIKRNLHEKTGLDFNINSCALIRDKGADSVSSLKVMSSIGTDAYKISNKILEDFKNISVDKALNYNERQH